MSAPPAPTAADPRPAASAGAWESFARALSLLGPASRRRLWVLAALILAGSALEVLGVGIVFPLIQVLGDPAQAGSQRLLAPLRDILAPIEDHAFLVVLVSGAAVLFLVKNAFLFASTWWQNAFILGTAAEIGQRSLAGYLLGPFVSYLRRSSAEVIRNQEGIVGSVCSGTLLSGIRVATEFLIMTAIIAILFVAAPKIALIVATVLLAALSFFYLVLRHRFAAWGQQNVENHRRRIECLQHSLGAIKEIKIAGREAFFIEHYRVLQAEVARLMAKIAAMSEFPRLALETLLVGAVTIVILITLMQDARMADTIATLALFAAAGFRLMPSANRIVAALTNLRASAAIVDWVHHDVRSAEGVAGFDESPPEIPPPEPFRELILDNVSFAYSGGGPVLENINLSIRRGESVALVGRSGAGKSTLADIILGLLAPASGRVSVDGRDISADLRAWQRRLGYVPQASYILDGTIGENVALGVSPAERDETAVRRALAQAQLDDFVAGLPKGLATRVGEMGIRLSGGQRQRLSIARALYRDPGILIFDEATSSLDGETENAVTLSLDRLRNDKTMILIAHRLSTVRHCDRIVLLDGGRVADTGSFDELARRNPVFRRMVELGRIDLPGESVR